jgi:hypothetical protein
VPYGLPVVLFGPQQHGKSSVARRIVSGVTLGSDIYGRSVGEPADALWYAGEEALDLLHRDRILAIGGDPRRVHFPQLDLKHNYHGYELPGLADHIKQQIERFRARIVVLDPIRAFFRDGVDPYGNQAARIAFKALTPVCQQTGVAMILLMHPRKDLGPDPTSWLCGGGEWMNIPRQVILNIKDPLCTTQTLLWAVKAGIKGAVPKLRYVLKFDKGQPVPHFMGTTDRTDEDMTAAAGKEVNKDVEAVAEMLLRTHLAKTPMKTVELYKLAKPEGPDQKIMLAVARRWGMKPFKKGNYRTGDQAFYLGPFPKKV